VPPIKSDRLLEQQFPQLESPYHEIRWMRVREAMSEMNLRPDEAYEWASMKLADTPAHGGRDTMMKSYQKIERSLPENARRREPAVRSNVFWKTLL
jgi:hypothetical protein